MKRAQPGNPTSSGQCRSVPCRARWRSSFTLVEVLAALALAALLLGTAAQMAVQSERLQRASQAGLGQDARESVVFESIREDLRGMDVASSGSLELVAMPQPTLRLRRIAAVGMSGNSPHEIRHPAWVRYQVVASDLTQDGHTLLRSVTDLTEPGGRIPLETISTRLRRMQFEVRVGGRWLGSFPSAGEKNAPDALRVTCEWDDGDRPKTRVFRVGHE